MTENIDILSYELKYKNNQEVLDLLNAYQISEGFLQCEYDNAEKEDRKIDRLESSIANMQDNITQSISDIEDAIEDLAGCQSLKKSEILNYLSKGISMLESIVKDLKDV